MAAKNNPVPTQNDTVSNSDGAIKITDDNHKASVIPEDKTITAFSPELFNPIGAVSPTEATANAVMPELIPPAEKRGRGRPKGNGAKKTTAATPEETAGAAQANAAVVMKALDLVLMSISSGEFVGDANLRTLTELSLTEVMAEHGIELPAWARCCVFGALYSSAALNTPTAKKRAVGAWARVKAWYVLWKD